MSAPTRTAKRNAGFFNDIADWYMKRPTWQKIAIPLGAGLLLRAGIRRARGAATKGRTDRTYGQELTQSMQAEPPTYSDAEYQNFASRLFTAMEYSGTTESEIEEVMKKMLTKTDVLKLIKAFGTRAISFFGWAQYYTLPEAFAEELDPDDLETYVNNPLKKNGVNFRF